MDSQVNGRTISSVCFVETAELKQKEVRESGPGAVGWDCLTLRRTVLGESDSTTDIS